MAAKAFGEHQSDADSTNHFSDSIRKPTQQPLGTPCLQVHTGTVAVMSSYKVQLKWNKHRTSSLKTKGWFWPKVSQRPHL